MFFLLLTACGILFTSCGSNQQTKKDPIEPPRVNCPEGGDCTFEVLQKSNLTLKSDQTGALYPEVEPGDRVVVRYQYKKNTSPNALDSDHSEYVYFEIDPGRVELALKDADIQRVKMVYGRICFCKGETGYYPVRKGNLFIYQNDGDLLVRSSFSIPKVPQTIKEIDERLTYFPQN